MTSREKARAFDAILSVRKFNKQFPVGSTVMWRPIGRKDVPFQPEIVKTEAFELHGQALVFFEGKSSYCSIDKKFVRYSA